MIKCHTSTRKFINGKWQSRKNKENFIYEKMCTFVVTKGFREFSIVFHFLFEFFELILFDLCSTGSPSLSVPVSPSLSLSLSFFLHLSYLFIFFLSLCFSSSLSLYLALSFSFSLSLFLFIYKRACLTTVVKEEKER